VKPGVARAVSWKSIEAKKIDIEAKLQERQNT